MQAIVTKFHSATVKNPSRVSATCQGKRVYVSWDHSLDVNQNHNRAACKLLERMKWLGYGRWLGSGLPDGTGNAYVCVDTQWGGTEGYMVEYV